jgi:thiazole synthase
MINKVKKTIMDSLYIGDYLLKSKLILGTGKFGSYEMMRNSIIASGTQLVTIALKRVEKSQTENIINFIPKNVDLLPNTSGARNAKEAILAAQLSEELFHTKLIKLEIHPDPRYLLPDPIETLIAAEELVKQGFVVFPYIQADPVLCKRLEYIGIQCVMPLGSPIGSNLGLKTRSMLEIIIAESNVPVIIDAGIGAPSHAIEAIELGADAVLVNTAIAIADNPMLMAEAFKMAVDAAEIAKKAGMAKSGQVGENTSPLEGFIL